MKVPNPILKLVFVITCLFFSNFLYASEHGKSFGIFDLNKESEFVVSGKVSHIESFESSPGRVYSKIYFSVDKCYKGNLVSGAVIIIKVFGGIVGRWGFLSLQEAQFVKDQESILFLNRSLSKNSIEYFYHVTGINQGKFNLVKESGITFILRDKFVSEGIKIGQSKDSIIISNYQKVKLDDFINQLNSIITKNKTDL